MFVNQTNEYSAGVLLVTIEFKFTVVKGQTLIKFVALKVGVPGTLIIVTVLAPTAEHVMLVVLRTFNV